ncbi:MAG TPA: ABC transporter permease [Chloroflexia bacterium]|nr:ABC transporter permease [Chloroflexia bacterium]
MATAAIERKERPVSARYLRRWRWPLVAVAILVIVFIWRTVGGNQPLIDLLSISTLTLSFATPITLGALSGTFSERSGVVNIAIEGMMLTGAFFGAMVGALTGNIWLGVLVAPFTGMALAILHAVLSIYFRVDQIISGTVINIFALGLTSYLLSLVFTSSNRNQDAGTLPSVGFAVNNVNFSIGLISIIAIVLVFVAHYVIFYTAWGLRTRAVGENPRAADTAGVNVFKVRYISVLISGLLAGLGGTYFSLQVVGYFRENMTVGSGFIALAAMIFGKWTPLGSWGAALLFGFCQALDSSLQSWYGQIEWLHTFTQALPYVVTVIVLTGLIGQSRPPAADGVPYTKQ